MEMVVALVLLGIVSVTVTTLNGNLFLGSTEMRDVQQKTHLLQACMDQLIGIEKASGFSSISASPSPCAAGVSVTIDPSCPSNLATNLPNLPAGQQCKKVLITATGLSNPVTLLFLQ